MWCVVSTLALGGLGLVAQARANGYPTRSRLGRSHRSHRVGEAVAEALAYGPDRTAAVLSNARPDAPWRPAMQLAQPTARLANAIASLHRFVVANATPNGSCTYDSVLTAARQEVPDEKPLDRMVRHALLSMLEERQTRRVGPQRAMINAAALHLNSVARG